MARNFYEVLGVPRSASDKEIRAAYRKLARQYHPDVNPNDRASESRFKEVAGAFEVLGDPENRKKYDKYGDRWAHADQLEEMERQRGAWANSSGEATFDASGLGDFGSIFENMFRRERAGPRRQRSPRAGQNAETPIEVTLEEAFRGTTRTIQLESLASCDTCSGAGEVEGNLCVTCGGSGHVSRPRRLEVKVPAGVATGSRVRVAGEGHPGVFGGRKGDLYLLVTVKTHPRFERQGDNLYVDVDVPLLDAVLGGEVEVPTIDGRVALAIKELTQNGTSIRLTGKGMPHLGNPDRHGDMFARIRVRIPTTLSSEQRALYQQLRDLEGSPVGAARKGA